MMTLQRARHFHEKHYGPGLVGLINPVTHEWNHEAVIKQRGGRPKEQYIGTIHDFYIP